MFIPKDFGGTIWVFGSTKYPNKDKFLAEKFKEGLALFGWGWFDITLSQEELYKNNPENTNDVSAAIQNGFLFDIRSGDWVVRVNSPSWGNCITGKVTQEYFFDENIDYDNDGDFKHGVKVDPASVFEFNRNDKNVLPQVSRALKPRSRWQRCYYIQEFFQSLENLENKIYNESDKSQGEIHLLNDTGELLTQFVEKIQSNFPRENLESLMQKVFENLPDVESVFPYQQGWGTDHGIDLLIELKTQEKMNLFNTPKEIILVQCKSYQGIHDNLQAIEDIRKGFNHLQQPHNETNTIYRGLIVSTAKEISENFKNELDKFTEETNIETNILYGMELAKWILKYL